MRRLALFPLLLAPISAEAQDAFCTGLRQIVQAAAQDFAELPLGTHYLHGSINERRGVVSTQGGPPRGVYYAVMLRDESSRAPAQADARFRALQGEIGRCLPQAQATPAAPTERGRLASWTLERAVVGLREEVAQGFATSAEVEVSIASRW